MGKRGKSEAKIPYGEENLPLKDVILLSSSDDEDANGDWSLEIVKTSSKREWKSKKETDLGEIEKTGLRSNVFVDLLSSSSDEVEFVASRVSGAAEEVVEAVKVKKKKKRSKNSKKKKNIEVDVKKAEEPSETVTTVDTEAVVMFDNVQKATEYSAMGEAMDMEAVGIFDDVIRADGPLETDETMGKEANGISEHSVLQKLLRGPRYFHPSESHWGACYNCGDEGHAAVDCTAEKRKKPCFVCGKSGHGAKQCSQGRYCFICRGRGHIAKNCPEKDQDSIQHSKICLRCGDTGHDMLSCRNGYASDDLKAIQCYICKNFGHLCCVDIIDTGSREISCYNCGQSGHTGLGCAKPRGDRSAASLTICYKCGEEGHFARGCTKFAKPSRWTGKPLTPTRRFSEEGSGILGFRSAPHDICEARKKKLMLCKRRENTSNDKSKRRVGSVVDDLGELPDSKSKANGWISPMIPKRKGGHTICLSATREHPSSSSSSFNKKHKVHKVHP